MSRTTTALVTGGAGLIGSHVVDQALAAGWDVRILDNLQPQTHGRGKPAWVPAAADFVRGDVRHRRDWERALDGVDVVFHQAAYGGYMPEIAKFVDANGVGTALLLETIRDRRLPVRKVVVASSQAVYNEGAYRCPEHGPFYGTTRAIERLERGDYDVYCPACDAAATPIPTDEDAPTGGENVYAISKMIQERLVLSWGRATGIPAVALRYSCTYGPRQSLFNPYTGVIAIFCTRLVNDLPPVVYEDGGQSRDLVYVEDVARANLLVAGDARADGRVFNVGTGRAAAIGDLARLLGNRLGKPIAPELPGEFRPGEMRALISDTARIAELGFAPRVDLEAGIDRYLAWVREQGEIRDYFAAAERRLRRRDVVKRRHGAGGGTGAVADTGTAAGVGVGADGGATGASGRADGGAHAAGNGAAVARSGAKPSATFGGMGGTSSVVAGGVRGAGSAISDGMRSAVSPSPGAKDPGLTR